MNHKVSKNNDNNNNNSSNSFVFGRWSQTKMSTADKKKICVFTFEERFER